MRKLSSDYKWGGLGLEAMFLEWIIRSTKQGGLINIVIPDGILSNINNQTLKTKLVEQCYIKSIISLPAKAFFNTTKKTYILTLEKKIKNNDGTYPLQKRAVFSYLCSSIGETLDVYRFDTPDNNDLKDAVDNYNLWRNTEPKIIEEIITKRAKGRFKSIPISDFDPSKSWIIENWWTEDEQVALGLKKEIIKQSIDDFIMLINETEELMQSIRGELECLK